MADTKLWKQLGWFTLRRSTIVVGVLVFVSPVLYFITSHHATMSFMPSNQSRFCGGELMSFPSYNASMVAYGKKFHCSFVKYLKEFKLSTRDKIEEPAKIVPSDVPFVIYASSNHFLESREALRRLRSMGNNRIIYYDLGLDENELTDLRTVCNLEVVQMNFTRYPPFVRQLGTYSFKPIIMAEMFVREPYFWVIDSSARFFNLSEIEVFYGAMNRGEHSTFLAGQLSTHHSIYAATHPGMYSYLPLAAELTYLDMYPALTMFVVRSIFSRDVIKWNLLCALTEECIAPKSSGIYCKIDWKNKRARIDDQCHRFDQSSMNIILSSLWERDGIARRENETTAPFATFATAERGSSYRGNLPTDC